MLQSTHSFTMQLCLLCCKHFDDRDRYKTVHQQSIMQFLLGSLQEPTWLLGLASSCQHQKGKKEHCILFYSFVIKAKVKTSLLRPFSGVSRAYRRLGKQGGLILHCPVVSVSHTKQAGLTCQHISSPQNLLEQNPS